ncbi:hypothetical protein ACS0TY_007556 [Phlomoides rotata]
MPIVRKLRKRSNDEESSEQKSKQSADVVKGNGNITTHSCDENENDDKESTEQKSKQCVNVVKDKGHITTHSCDESENDSINLGSNDLKIERRSRRGPTQLEKLHKQRLQGIKKDVMFNKHGQPIGEAGAEMQSYIGVLAREKVKITYKSWKQVPHDVKELIWVSVNLTFNVDPKWKTGCLRSANDKWRTYKTNLTTDIVLKHKDDPAKLNKPPVGILPSDWSAFVSNRLSEDFLKLSALQRERRMQHKYPHRLSRKGYAGLAETIKHELCDDKEVDRAILWKRARLNKEGEYEGKELVETVYKIDDYIRQMSEGALKSNGATKDSTTLGTEKHGGRARAVWGDITPTVLLKCSSGRRNIDQDMKKEKKAELMEVKKKISEQDARIEKLESVVSRLLGKDVQIDEMDSCLEKPQCPTDEDENNFSKDEKFDDDVQLIDKADSLEGKLVALTLGSSNAVVAYGTVVAMYKLGSKLHGAPFPENCMRVSIDEAVDESAPLPIPIPSECENIGDAVGSHVAWPEHLIMMQNKPREKRDGQEKKLMVSTSMPKSLKMLYCYSKLALEDGGSISMHLDDDLFDEESELYVHLEDIIPFCELEPISCNCIVVYIWHLYKKLKEENKLEKFRFVNPHSIPHEPTTRMEKDWVVERLNKKARVLADRLIGTAPNQLVLVPCNIGFHWILSVIDPYKGVVFLLDPLGHRIRDLDWKFVVDTALKLFNVKKRKKGKKRTTWKIVLGPRQPDATQCGFYVLRYMRQIIEEVAPIRQDSLQAIFTEGEYSQKEIDEVRSEWAECVQEHI